jgi:L-alanine-DL-glutamate epimerase-like enolase superfamily enzyme
MTRYHTLVRLAAGDADGWGEISGVGDRTPLGPDLRRLAAMLRDEPLGADPRGLRPLALRLRRWLGDTALARQVRCGVDLALHDLVGRAQGVPVSDLLGGAVRDTLRVAYAIGSHRRVEDVPASIAHVGERLARGFDLIRVYIGLNGAAEVRRRIPFPVSEHADAPADALDVVNLRCISLGGLTAAREVVSIVEAAGLRCVIGAAHEVNLGTAAQVHLGATLANHDFPADCIGPETYLEDVTTTLLRYAGSALHVPTDPGLGFDVDDEKLRRFAIESR